MMEVCLNGSKIKLSPRKSIGKGGEADVYDIGKGMALKVYKRSDHPDYDGLPLDQQAASVRISLHQKKLPAFPKNLPDRVIRPQELATDPSTGEIIGYTMRYLAGAEVLRKFSSRVSMPPGTDKNDLSAIFEGLHNTLRGIHRAGVVIGDFNDLNVLVSGRDAYIIDADSFQYDSFLCIVFTARFLDPLLCDPLSNVLAPVRPFNAGSDWFAFNVMLMQSLLYVDPYGGVYMPADPSMRLSHDLRPLNRITVFHPDVRYPKSAIHYRFLPDELLHYFHRVFLGDVREEFPLGMLQSMRWTECPACGAIHARNRCPSCIHPAAMADMPAVVVRGEITVTRMFGTRGTILAAASCEGKLFWLYHENGRYYREDGSAVIKGELKPTMKFGLTEKATVLGEHGNCAMLIPGQSPEHIQVDTCDNAPSFSTNGKDLVWMRNGQLFRRGGMGNEYLGDALEGQTFFRVGPKFGFGFYRAGTLCGAFVFDCAKRSINDMVKIPWLRYPVVDAACYFTSERCWLFLATQEQGRTVHRCIVILSNGAIEAVEEGAAGDGSWLSSLYGKCAARHFLLVATDEGLVRIEARQGVLVRTKEFPDTEGIVDERTQIFAGKGGLYLVKHNEVSFIKMG